MENETLVERQSLEAGKELLKRMVIPHHLLSVELEFVKRIQRDDYNEQILLNPNGLVGTIPQNTLGERKSSFWVVETGYGVRWLILSGSVFNSATGHDEYEFALLGRWNGRDRVAVYDAKKERLQGLREYNELPENYFGSGKADSGRFIGTTIFE